MVFNHNPIILPAKRVETYTFSDGFRIYHDLDDALKYPSITTILKDYKKDVIKKWKNRIGEIEANRISQEALDRGNIIHEMSERYIKNESTEFLKTYDLKYRQLFNSIRLRLDKNVNNIRMQESALFSRKLKIAGRCDLIAEWNKELSVIDFKGSGGQKKKEWIEHYFIQVAFYALAFYELTKIPIKQGIIVVANDGSKPIKTNSRNLQNLGNTVEIFKFNILDYKDQLVEQIKNFYKSEENINRLQTIDS